MRATCPTFTQSSRSTSEASPGSVSPTWPTATTLQAPRPRRPGEEPGQRAVAGDEADASGHGTSG